MKQLTVIWILLSLPLYGSIPFPSTGQTPQLLTSEQLWQQLEQEQGFVPPEAITLEIDLNDPNPITGEEKVLKFDMQVNQAGLVVIDMDQANGASTSIEVFNPTPGTLVEYTLDYSSFSTGIYTLSIMACVDFVTHFKMADRTIVNGMDVSELTSLKEFEVINSRIAGPLDIVNSAQTIEVFNVTNNHFITTIFPFFTANSGQSYPALTELVLDGNDLSGTLDVSSSTSLEIIHAKGADVSGVANGGNDIGTVMLPAGSHTIRDIDLTDNLISHSLDFTGYNVLELLYLNNNAVPPISGTKTLTLGVLPELIDLRAPNVLFDQTVNISACDKLEICRLYKNLIDNVVLKPYSGGLGLHPLREFDAGSNEINVALDFRAYSSLEKLDLNGYLTTTPTADHNMVPKVYVNVSDCQLTSINIQHNDVLTEIDGLSACDELETLFVPANNLSAIHNLANFSQLKNLIAWSNPTLTTTFDLTAANDLLILSVYNTGITDIILPSNNSVLNLLVIHSTNMAVPALEGVVDWMWTHKCLPASPSKFSIANTHSNGISTSHKQKIDSDPNGVNTDPANCNSCSPPTANLCTIEDYGWTFPTIPGKFY